MLSSEGLRPASAGRKPLGKLASRLDEVKNPWRQVSTLELSHNEAARLATDALLEHGEKEYRRVLTEERELNFLSPLEIRYITQHAAKSGVADSNGTGGPNERDCGDGDAVSELTSGTYFPMMSDEEPPMLELGWPDAPLRYGPSETQIYFQRDKSHNVKDLIRSLINKAKKVIALVMDIFTDVDLLCDLMEASNKRKVPVYILLDHKNLESFTDMCETLDIRNTHFSNMRVRSVCGDTYCTKSGKKFTGQVLEKFMIIDCDEVIAGSYSFTWLSAQVHSNMVMHFSGRIADSFDREFRCLYADSQIIDCFYNPEEEELPFYPPYQSVMASMGLGPGLGLGLDLQSDSRQRVCSENSSSQSSNSVSSVKAAPGMTPNTVYKVTQGHDKKDLNTNSHPSPERRGGQTPTPQNYASSGTRANGGVLHSVTPERPSPPYSGLADRPPPAYGTAMGMEWSKAGLSEVLRANVAGNTSKFQALGLYDHKPNMFHSAGLNSGIPASNLTPKSGGAPSPLLDSKLPSKRTPSNPFLNRLSDLFLPPSKEKEPYNYRQSPSPLEAVPWGGPDLSQAEPESQQSPPPPLSPTLLMTRQDHKRMTLGHSKLDLVNQYNQMKSKQVYSRFELKSSN